MSEERGGGGGGGLPGRPAQIPGLPENARLLDLSEFKTLNRQVSRASIGDQEMAWSHNLMPTANYYLRAVPDNGAAIYGTPAPANEIPVSAAFFDTTDVVYNFPAMLDSPVGSLSLWIYTSRDQINAVYTTPSSAYFPDIPDGDIFTRGGLAYLFFGVAGNTSEVDVFFIEQGKTRPGVSFGITAISNATHAVVTTGVSVSHISVGDIVDLLVSGSQVDWNIVGALGANHYQVLAVAGNQVTLLLDTSSLSVFNPSLQVTKLLQTLQVQTVTNVTSANPAVLTFQGGHAIPAGATVITFFFTQTGWSTFEDKSFTVLSITSNTVTLDADTTGFPTYNPADNGTPILIVYNAPTTFIANVIDPHNEDFVNEHVQPIPSGQWVNLLMSWDTNHPAFEKIFHMYYGETSIPTVPFSIDENVAFSVPWSHGASDPTAWQFGGGSFGIVPNLTGACILAYIAEVWFAPGFFIDFSVPANRAKFHSASNKPVDLGPDGSLPTGVVPTLYQHIPNPAPDPNVSLGFPVRVADRDQTNGAVRNTDLANGITASSLFMFSIWIWGTQGGSGFTNSVGTGVNLFNNTCDVDLKNFDLSQEFRFHFDFDVSGSNLAGLTNVRVAVDTGHAIGAKIVKAYVNNTDVSGIVTIQTDNAANISVDWTANGGFTAFGGNGYSGDFWIAPNQFIDPGSLFIDGSGNPVDLGPTGALPTGTAPSMYFHIAGSQPANDMAINLGTGGAFTISPALGNDFRLLPPAASFCKNNTGHKNLILGPNFTTFNLAPTSPSD